MAQKAKLPPKLTCQRCGHTWVPRVALVRICAHCKSAQWDVIKVPFDIPPDAPETTQEGQS